MKTSNTTEISPHFPVPLAPSGLCFDRDEFVKDNFSVDRFIQTHRKQVPLEDLRDDLGVYLKILRSAMIELINKDYADFVNLSTNLIGLDKAIGGLEIPLGQLKEEVLHVKSMLDETICEIQNQLQHQNQLREKRQHVENMMLIHTCLDKMDHLLALKESKTNKQLNSNMLERVASQFNQLIFCVDRCPKEYLTANVLEHISEISNILDTSVETMFMDKLQAENSEGLTRCLRIYVTLDKIAKAEELFRTKVVSPYMDEVISESSLQADPQGLKGLYQRVLNFIPARMKELLEVTAPIHTRHPVVKRFHFIVNSIWPEVIQKLQDRLSILFAPGNPDLFLERYNTTLDFIGEIETHCGSMKEVQMLRGLASYKIFLEKWNLPVYFQIRFQKIGGSFETAIQDSKNYVVNDVRTEDENTSSLLHPVSRTLFETVDMCWAPGIYVPALTHRFWKLTLQLLARYNMWIKGHIIQESKTIEADSVDTSLSSSPRPSRKSDNRQIGLLVYLFMDLKWICNELLPKLTLSITERVQEYGVEKDQVISNGMTEAKEVLSSNLPILTHSITDSISEESASNVRQVSDIPRLYRRTNREVPSKPCAYVTCMLTPLVKFRKEDGKWVAKDQWVVWMEQILSRVTQQYYSAVSDVLTSIQRMEESLRRLKKSRGGGNTDQLKGMSDDDKIRLQLSIDVESYLQQVEKLGVKSSNVEKLTELTNLLEAAKKL